MDEQSKKEIKEKFGERLQYLRLDKGLTQEQHEEELAMSKGMISSYERGVNSPEFARLIQICNYFQADPRYLLLYTNNPYLKKNGKDSMLEMISNLKITDDMKIDLYDHFIKLCLTQVKKEKNKN